jgi:hypothetical protein
MRNVKSKYAVYGECGGEFSNIREAKKCAKETSTLSEDKESSVWLIEDGCSYIDYENGKMTRDGWTRK